MPTLTAKKPKRKPKPVPATPSSGSRLAKGMREVLAVVSGEDTDGLRYSIPAGATPAEVLAISRAAEKKLRAKQAARRERLTVAPFAPADVYALRRCLGVGAECLADFLNVPHALVEAWEDGTKAPKGAALRLLADIRARPDYWRDQLRAADTEEASP